jgi:hypothetical protein
MACDVVVTLRLCRTKEADERSFEIGQDGSPVHALCSSQRASKEKMLKYEAALVGT